VGSLATVVVVGGVHPRRPALALAIAVAGPANTGIEVVWDAPAACPDAATARAEILARVADRPAARELEATARVRALDDGAWEVEVLLRSDEGTATRTLRAASCREALTATAVVVAIAVDPSLAPLPSEDPPAEILVPPPPASEPSPTVVEPSLATSPASERPLTDEAGDSPSPSVREPAIRRELGVSLSARGGLDFGALPSPAGHVAAAVGLFGRRFEVQAGALHRIRTDSAVSALARPAGGRFRLTVAQLRAGPRLRWGAFELPLAAGLELGTIWARGIGDVEPITVRRTWAAALASAGIGWAPQPRLPRAAFALQLGLDGVVPLLRPKFTLDDEVEVLTVGPFAIRAWLGVAGRFAL
jgi:hypothetical protein